MLEKIWGGPERRRHRRYDTAVDVSVRVEMFGFEGQSRPFFASGRTINVSRGGVYAEIDVPVTAGSICKIFFREGGAGTIEPANVSGRVLRCEESGDTFRIAVAFDAPLRRLELPDRAATPATAGARDD